MSKNTKNSYNHPQRSWGKVIFSEVCVKNSDHRGGVHGGGHARQGVCMAGGVWQGDVHGRGACMAGGMHGRGACMEGGHAWQGGMRGIWSMSGWYASYWTAFLFTL